MKFTLIFLLNSAIIFSVSGQSNITSHTIDSLTDLLQQAKTDSAKFDLNLKLGYSSQSFNASKAIEYLNISYGIAKKNKDTTGMMTANLTLSYFYSQTGESAKSIELAQEALQYAEEKKADPSMALAFIGFGYEAQGDLKNGLEYARKAYLTTEEGQKESLKAKLKDSTLPFDVRSYVAGPTRLGILFEKMNQLDSAQYYGKMAYQRTVKFPDPFFFCQACSVLGKVYSRTNRNEEASSYFHQGLNTALIINYPASIQESQMALANFYHKLNKPDSAIYFAKQSYEGAINLKNYSILQEAAGLLRKEYAGKGIYDKALYYNDLSIEAKDSMLGADKIREVSRLTYNEEKRQQKILQEIETAKVEFQNRVKLYSLLAILAGAVLFATVMLRNNRQKQKANILLQEQKEKIQSTLKKLESTQSQLIQSEKMASLGELTAGIAHEIQNPLNFVNNFSDVNRELLAELRQELETGNISEAKLIVSNIAENEERVGHHGKRADAIVKGMLQHSKSSIGAKEFVDFNALISEYIRLSIHGMQAKDSTFNVDIETDFDRQIGQLNIIPQDFGRVMLNLFNNAFYAVNERKQKLGESFSPLISVKTKLNKDKVEIIVKDNGGGIPSKTIEKIFQPFFTTKPTGQGTGLGLSLSYDIITKGHGGELKVGTIEGEETEFTIVIPQTV